MRKLNLVGITIIGTILGMSVAASKPTHASSLVPQQEGEIKLTNIDCITSTCIDVETDYGFRVTSQAYDFDDQEPQYGLSRLFVDQRSTENDYGFGITFLQQDTGTNPTLNDYSFRPVAYLATSADASSTDTPAENGQLEVGRYLVEFDQTVSELTLSFFDIEDSGLSGVLEVNGTPVSQLLNGDSDGRTQSITLKNVNSFVVQLGNSSSDSQFPIGDGVVLQVTSIPEPATTFGLGALAVASLFGLQQRRKVAQPR